MNLFKIIFMSVMLSSVFTLDVFAVEESVFEVDQMDCISCPIIVKTALKRLAGVESTEVTLDPGEATVRYDPEITTPQKIAQVISNSGFPARVKQ